MLKIIRDGAAWRAKKSGLRAVKTNLHQLRAMLAEAVDKEWVIKTDAAKMFISAVDRQVAMIEYSVNSAIED